MPTFRYALVNAAYWAGFCLLLAFSSVFLLARGLGNAQIGLVLAASGLASAALQPLVAGRVDRSRVPTRVWVAGLASLIALDGVALALVPADPLRDALLFGGALCVLQVTTPLVNALGMDAARAGVAVDFGTARAVGSFTFALTSTAAGALVGAFGAEVLPRLVVGGQVALAVAALAFFFKGGHSGAAEVAQAIEPETAALDAAGRRRFALLLVGMTGAYTSHAAINNFMFQIASSHGGAASDLGVAFTVAALAETIPMLFFRRLLARWRPGTLLRVAAVGIAVKALATLLAPNLTVFLATMLLQIVSFALLIPASVYYVDRLLPTSERVRGQSYMTLTLTLGTVISGLGGGALLDAAGVPALLVAGTLAAGVAVACVVAGTASDLGSA